MGPPEIHLSNSPCKAALRLGSVSKSIASFNCAATISVDPVSSPNLPAPSLPPAPAPPPPLPPALLSSSVVSVTSSTCSGISGAGTSGSKGSLYSILTSDVTSGGSASGGVTVSDGVASTSV